MEMENYEKILEENKQLKNTIKEYEKKNINKNNILNVNYQKKLENYENLLKLKTDELNIIKKELENKNKIINNLEENKKDLKLNCELNEKKIKSLENNINEIKKKSGDKDKMIEEYLKLKNENEKLKTKLEHTNNIIKINNDNDVKNLNYQLNEDLKKERDDKADLKLKLEQLKKKRNEDLENYKKNDYNVDFIGKQLENFYDIIINIKSIRELANKDGGWEIKWNKNMESIKEFMKSNEKLLKVGILGNGNMGKSFLLSRIFKENIPSGYSVITEGLSIKMNKEKLYALLDSAGLQTPLLQNDEEINKNLNEEDKFKEYENLYKDKTQTENFIQNLILYLSDMLLIVVGKITFNEQRLINKIKNELINQKSKKPIFIIHNLLNFQTCDQVNEHINNTLLKSASFKLIKVRDIKRSNKINGDRFYYIEDNKNNNNDFYIYHLIMARESTEAGDYYNNYLYDFLEERFNEFPDRSPLSILDEIKNKFVEWSSDLLEEQVKEENITIENEGDKEKKFIYHCEDKNEIPKIMPKACISDELGLSIYRSSGYEPPYVIYVEDNKKLVIQLELPGNVIVEDAYADLNQNQIFIKGNKEDKNELSRNINENNLNISKSKLLENEKIRLLKNTRKYGKFTLIIPFGNEIKLADELPEEEINDIKIIEGIITIKFILARRRVPKA